MIENGDALDLIHLYSKPMETSLFTRLFYVDPPYHAETLRSVHGYGAQYNTDHEALLTVLQGNPYYVLLSGYRNALYDDMLQDWHRVETGNRDHGGNSATECLWINPLAWDALQREKNAAKQLSLFDRP